MHDDDRLLADTIATCGPALRRLVAGWEADSELQQDLLQDIHLELCRRYQCEAPVACLQIWAYDVAYRVVLLRALNRNHKVKRRVHLSRLTFDGQQHAEQRCARSMMFELIDRLEPVDRQVALLYLAGESAASIGAATGTTAAGITGRVRRIKKRLAYSVRPSARRSDSSSPLAFLG